MAARAPDCSSIGHNHIIASLVCVCLVALSSNVWAQAGAEEFDFGLYSDALVDDPSTAGPASYHLLKAPWDHRLRCTPRAASDSRDGTERPRFGRM